MHSNKQASDRDDNVMLTVSFSKFRIFTVHSFRYIHHLTSLSRHMESVNPIEEHRKFKYH